VVVALALALAACGTSGAAPEAPPTSAVPVPADGEVITETVAAPSLANNMLGDPAEREIAVYLPPSYASSDARYPVVYFLAGYEERISMFGQHTDELWAQMLTPGKLEFIVVEVDGISALGGNFYANSPVSGNAEDFLTQDLVGYVDTTYRTIPEASARGLSGFSMGGSGTINVGPAHPDVYDGVDGSRVYLYGEGWNFGEVADNRLFTQATQGQLGGTGIGTFSDRLRDAVRGGGPFDEDPRVQGFGSGAYSDPNGAPVNGTEAEQLARAQHQADLVRLGLAGNLRDFSFLASDGQVRTGAEIDYNGRPAGYAQSPEEVITYVDAHDNETLFDALTLKLPTDTPMADRVRMNTPSLATTALAQTPSFWHAGADLLRSKSLGRNSYNSGDWFNVLDISGQRPPR